MGAALSDLLKNPATANPTFDAALTAESLARLRGFVDGVRAYQNHPVRRDILDSPVVWQCGSTCLRDYNPEQSGAPTLLVIPSLINRYDILDLDRDHSFLRTLSAAGFRPLVVDWGEPGEKENGFDVGDYVTQRLIPALMAVSQSGKKRVHILGYCMGGLLAMALAALRPAEIATLSLFATPWDFHKPVPMADTVLQEFLSQTAPMMEDAHAGMPVDIIQSMFALLQPLQTLTKFSDFAALPPDSAEARRFVLLEDWLNDGVPLAEGVARECLTDWYGGNKTAGGTWSVGEHIIDPHAITVPAYVVVPGKDKIVPPESALPLAKLLPHATLHEPMIGHIGMMASERAPRLVWVTYLRWLAEHA